jgi:uncharacterized membrane protein
MLVDDVWQLSVLYFVSLLWQLIAFPFLHRHLRHLNDLGWATGRVFTTLSIALLMWSLGSIGLKVNTDSWLLGIATIFSLVSFYYWKNNYQKYVKDIREKRWLILSEELLVFGGIFFMGVIRGFRPDLDNMEKFMDFGFIKQYLLTDKLPASDMWFSGNSINYYSFGHYWISIMIRWLGVKPEVGYNLVVALFFAITNALSFSLVVNILNQKYRKILMIAGGLISSVMVTLGGNSHIFWFFIKNQGLSQGTVPYWYAVSTRFIDKTITEFPAYTFTIADLHPHLIDLLVVLTFLIMLIAEDKMVATKKVNYFYTPVQGALVGIMIMTSTWDGGIYLMLWSVFKLIKVLKKEINFKIAFFQFLTLLLIASGVSYSWWHNFVMIPQGIGWVKDRSSFSGLVVVWGVQWFIGILSIIFLRRKPLVLTMVITAFILIGISEYVYVIDILVKTPRINTVFKLTYQSFVLFSLLAGVILTELIEKKRLLVVGILLTIIGILCLYPVTSYPNYYLGFTRYSGLDGSAWLKSEKPEEYAMARYLSENKNGKALIEYPGHSFSLSNSVSVFSGVPTVLGWREHEWLWRGNWNIVRERIEDIDTFYRAELDEKKKIIKKYDIGWIKVGNEERNNLIVDDKSLKALGDIVWKQDLSYIIKIRDN